MIPEVAHDSSTRLGGVSFRRPSGHGTSTIGVSFTESSRGKRCCSQNRCCWRVQVMTEPVTVYGDIEKRELSGQTIFVIDKSTGRPFFRPLTRLDQAGDLESIHRVSVANYFDGLVADHGIEVVKIISLWRDIDFVSMYKEAKPLRAVHLSVMGNALQIFEKHGPMLTFVIQKILKYADTDPESSGERTTDEDKESPDSSSSSKVRKSVVDAEGILLNALKLGMQTAAASKGVDFSERKRRHATDRKDDDTVLRSFVKILVYKGIFPTKGAIRLLGGKLRGLRHKIAGDTPEGLPKSLETLSNRDVIVRLSKDEAERIILTTSNLFDLLVGQKKSSRKLSRNQQAELVRGMTTDNVMSLLDGFKAMSLTTELKPDVPETPKAKQKKVSAKASKGKEEE